MRHRNLIILVDDELDSVIKFHCQHEKQCMNCTSLIESNKIRVKVSA